MPRWPNVKLSAALLAVALAAILACSAGASDWSTNGGGQWHEAGYWSIGVPDRPGAVAGFLGALTGPNAPANVAVTGNRTVGRIIFDNPNTYLIVQGTAGGTLTLDNGSLDAMITVETGAHCISAPLVFESSLVVDAHPDARLMSCANITLPAGKRITKRGGGWFEAEGGIDLDPTARFFVQNGESRARYVRGGSLEIGALARLTIPLNGAISGASRVASLTIDGAEDAWLGQLDLADNDLVVQSTPAEREIVLRRVMNQLKTARNAATGRWKGSGITSSAAQTSLLTGLAGVANPGFTHFSGQGVGPDDILVKYTWNGDANVDGVVNADDYFRIDSGFLAQPIDPTYAQGNFNYDSAINADDYFLIDSAFLGQTAVLGAASAASAGSLVSVPEPGAAVLGAGVCIAGAGRRRRGSRQRPAAAAVSASTRPVMS